MAERTTTIDVLITRMEELCDIENDSHFSSAEKFRIMNSAIAETWDLIIKAGRAEKYVSSATFSTVAGTLAYDLFTIAPTFYKIHQLYVVEGSQLRPLPAMNPGEIHAFTPPVSAVSMKLYYIPYSPVLTTGQTFDGINGWEEHTLMVACCAVKLKNDDDYSRFDRRRKQLEERILSAGQTDYAEPMRVVRKRRRQYDPFMLYSNNVNGYLVRGDNLEIFYNYGVIP